MSDVQFNKVSSSCTNCSWKFCKVSTETIKEHGLVEHAKCDVTQTTLVTQLQYAIVFMLFDL